MDSFGVIEEITKPKIALSEERKEIEVISKTVKEGKEKVVIADINSFAKAAVAIVYDEEYSVLSPAQFGCIQITPEVKFFLLEGESK